MVEVLAVSQVLLWIVVVALAVTVFALARQIGVLHERSAPLGALETDHGPGVGDKAPVFELRDLQGEPLTLGGLTQSGKDLLLLFLSPSCPMCNKLLPAVKSLYRQEQRGLDVVLVSDGAEKRAHEEFVRRYQLNGIRYVVSSTVGITFQVGKIPYAILIDAEGVVRSKGLVNTREHLESLFVAKETGYASLQQYVQEHGKPVEHGSAAIH
jgi:methylamine dehydrogenase accessory protein MauD